MTFTGLVGRIFGYPLRAIIWTCVRLQISPNILTFTGVVLNVVAAWYLAYGHFIAAGGWMVAANVFDYIDGKVAHESKMVTPFGAFFDSVMDRFSDITLFIGLIALYNDLGTGHRDYVITTSLAMMFAVMTSYARARAESLIEKCKVGFMERPERIVLLMIGTITNRMAGVLWVVLVLSILAVADRIYYTYLALNKLPMPSKSGLAGIFNRAFFWTDERATLPYDIWVIAILAFVWLVPPAWLGDPMAHDAGLVAWVQAHLPGR